MKDLQHIWSKGQTRQDDLPLWNESDLTRIRERSQTPLKQLRRNIYINSGFAIAIMIAFIALMVKVDGIWFRFFIGVVVLAYIAGILFNQYIIKTYLQEPPVDGRILDHLHYVYTGMKKAFRSLEIVAIFIYPIAMTAGFLLPLTLEGKLYLFQQGPELWLILLACFVFLTPLTVWAGRFLTKIAFGKYLEEIHRLTLEMSKSEIELNDDIDEEESWR